MPLGTINSALPWPSGFDGGLAVDEETCASMSGESAAASYSEQSDHTDTTENCDYGKDNDSAGVDFADASGIDRKRGSRGMSRGRDESKRDAWELEDGSDDTRRVEPSGVGPKPQMFVPPAPSAQVVARSGADAGDAIIDGPNHRNSGVGSVHADDSSRDAHTASSCALEKLRAHVDDSLRGFAEELHWCLQEWLARQDDVALRLAAQQRSQWVELMEAPIEALLQWQESEVAARPNTMRPSAQHASAADVGDTQREGRVHGKIANFLAVQTVSMQRPKTAVPTSLADATAPPPPQQPMAVSGGPHEAPSPNVDQPWHVAMPASGDPSALDERHGDAVCLGSCSATAPSAVDTGVQFGGLIPPSRDSDDRQSSCMNQRVDGDYDDDESFGNSYEEDNGGSPRFRDRSIRRKLSFSLRSVSATSESFGGNEQDEVVKVLSAAALPSARDSISTDPPLPPACVEPRLRCGVSTVWGKEQAKRRSKHHPFCLQRPVPEPLNDIDSSNASLDSSQHAEQPLSTRAQAGVLPDLPPLPPLKMSPPVLVGLTTVAAGQLKDKSIKAARAMTPTESRSCAEATEHQSSPPRGVAIRSLVRPIVSGQSYEIGHACLIFLGLVAAVWATERRAHLVAIFGDTTNPPSEIVSLTVLETSFCFLCFVDFWLRAVGLGWQLLESNERWWTIFDCIVVLVSTVDISVSWIRAAHGGGHAPTRALGRIYALRSVRMFRIIRINGPLRTIRLLHDLRLLLGTMRCAVTSMCWLMALLFFVALFVAMMLTDGAVTYGVEPSIDSSGNIHAHFGTVGRCLYSLLQVSCGGMSWGLLADALAPLPVFYRVAFHAAAVIGGFAAGGLATAVLTQAMLWRSQFAQEVINRGPRHEKRDFVRSMESTLRSLDSSGSGAVRLADFDERLKEEDVRAYFNAMELNIDHIRTLFALLDPTNTGSCKIDQLVSGCLYLEGRARAVDVVMLQYEVGIVRGMLQSLGEFVEDRLPTVATREGCVTDRCFDGAEFVLGGNVGAHSVSDTWPKC
eukprot:TRINITY_DN67835_c0_g1_i1.p1 TRINITY_DN67835_c0_g1~~TRINITY_DN67835_c0_g1_i1.p1  ORF type:complete len:1054 (-),score=167.82 TRINITY_DN67835_c0_g1_i1:95-3169(-)